MNTVEPIRDMETVNDIADYLKTKSRRNYMMFLFGIYSGLRISDILKLRVRDIRGKSYVSIREKKTGKEKRFPINKELSGELEEYIKDMRDYQYLFSSHGKMNNPLTRQQAYNILKDAGNVFGLENIGTHTLRKTFGYHMYQQTKDIVTLKELFNHSDISVTLRYIGMSQDTKDQAVMSLSYRK